MLIIKTYTTKTCSYDRVHVLKLNDLFRNIKKCEQLVIHDFNSRLIRFCFLNLYIATVLDRMTNAKPLDRILIFLQFYIYKLVTMHQLIRSYPASYRRGDHTELSCE
jgi:hypothetical protein